MELEESEGELLGRYERRLVEKYRFSLRGVIGNLCVVLKLLESVKNEVNGIENNVKKKFPQIQSFFNQMLEKTTNITNAIPLFVGYDQLVKFAVLMKEEIKYFDPRAQSWNSLRLYDKDYQGKVCVFMFLHYRDSLLRNARNMNI